MRVGWLADEPQVQGGAELTQAEFRAMAPIMHSGNQIQIVDCPPGGVVPGLSHYVIQNCVSYTLDDFGKIPAPATKYWHDVGPWIEEPVRAWLTENARQVCCSPIQAEYMGLKDATCIPPPVDLERFAAARSEEH